MQALAGKHFLGGSLAAPGMEFAAGRPFGGSRPGLLRRLASAATVFFRSMDERYELSQRGWNVFDTPLREYATGLGIDLEEHLEARLLHARKGGRRLRVLDVGMGSGRQWLPLLEKYGDCIDFWGTSQVMKYVEPGLRGRTKRAVAKYLLAKFEPESFDVVVSHCGMHEHELAGMIQAASLLSRGGELLVALGSKVDFAGLGSAVPGLETVSAPDSGNACWLRRQ